MSRVSVIIPCRNAESYIADALRSVLRQQQLLEVVLVDDGSRDRSVQVAQRLNDPRLRVIQGPQRGISAAFNAGLAAVRGEWVARCDADDSYPEDRLAWQVQWLTDHPGHIAVCGSFKTIDASGDELAMFEFARREENITDELLAGRARTHFCTYLTRVEALRAVGGCREWFRTAEDVDLQFRLAAAGPITFMPRLAYRYRIHDKSITHQQYDAERDFYWKCAQRFARDRRDNGNDSLHRGDPPSPPVHDGRRLQASSHSQGLLLGHAWRENADGRRWAGLVAGCRAVAAAPGNFNAWRSVAALALRSIWPRPVTGDAEPS